jgi:hypothetical protein
MVPLAAIAAPTVDEQGVVHVDTQVAVRFEELASILRRPDVQDALRNDIDVERIDPDPPCQRIQTRGKSRLLPLDATFRVCETANGWTTSLVESRALNAFEATWRFEPEGDQVVLHYALALDLSAPVPRVVVEHHMRKVAQKVVGLVVTTMEAAGHTTDVAVLDPPSHPSPADDGSCAP